MNSLVQAQPSDHQPAIVAWAAARVQKWFSGADDRQPEWERSLRLDERELERARIARELQDSMFHGLLGGSLQLCATASHMPEDSPGKTSLSRTLTLMHRVIDEGCEALRGHRAPCAADTTLEEALSEMCSEFMPVAKPRLRVFVKGTPHSLDPKIHDQICLISREALINAVHHSGAGCIEVEVEYSGRRVRVVVRDDGRGIDTQVIQWGREDHWGLLGMRERAAAIGAQLRMWSSPGAGTEVELSLPLAAAQA